MLKRTIILTLFMAAIVIGGLQVLVPVSAEVTVTSTNDQASVTVHIIDAFYTDADSDGYEDDVVAYFDIHLSGKQRYNLDIYPSLTLPSGTSFVYGYTINTRLSTLHCTMYFYDHATESGDYTFSVDVILYTGGVASGQVQYVFDPPGGSGDADPCGVLVVE